MVICVGDDHHQLTVDLCLCWNEELICSACDIRKAGCSTAHSDSVGLLPLERKQPTGDSCRRTIRVDDACWIGRHRQAFCARRVADRWPSSWQIIDIGNHLWRRVHLLQHAESILVDGPHPQCQTDFGVGRSKGRAFLPRYFTGSEPGNVGENAITGQINLPEESHRFGNYAGSVICIGDSKERTVGIELYAHRRIFGRGYSELQCPNGLMIETTEYHRPIGE